MYIIAYIFITHTHTYIHTNNIHTPSVTYALFELFCSRQNRGEKSYV